MKHTPDGSLTLVAALLVAHGRGDDAAGARIAKLTSEELAEIIGGDDVRESAHVGEEDNELVLWEKRRDEPLFTGIDSHGHKWVNGKQVKVGEKSASSVPTKSKKKEDNEGSNTIPDQLTPKAHKAMVAKCLAKMKGAPKPTRQEKKEAKAGLVRLGANKYRKNLVGNNIDRAKRRKKLQEEFGDGTSCPCLYCGIRVGDAVGEGTLEQDKIYTTAQGGRYRMQNLVPSCSGCNKVRSDMPFEEAIALIKPGEPLARG